MVTFRFEREFSHWALRARKHCVLCKVWSLITHKPGIAEIDEETASAATEAGAGALLSAIDANIGTVTAGVLRRSKGQP